MTVGREQCSVPLYWPLLRRCLCSLFFVFCSRYPDSSLVTIASKLQDKAAWGEQRYARFAKLLQFCLSDYFKKGLNMCSTVVGDLTKVLYKVQVSPSRIMFHPPSMRYRRSEITRARPLSFVPRDPSQKL